MSLYDQHLHTKYSMDSEADPEQNVQHAIAAGLAGLTFTDHFDSHPTEWDDCVYDYEALAEHVRDLRARYGDRIWIGHGIEICYQRDEMDSRIMPMLENHDYDMVLLSVHWFSGKALHVKDHWGDINLQTATREYLETVLEAVRFAGEVRRAGGRGFDVLGHLDLVKRYTQRYMNAFDITSHADLVDHILETCLESQLVPELNMSSLRQGIDEPMPADWVVRRYVELGGTAMSLGSDAHISEHIGLRVPEGAELLQNQGINALAVFREGQRCDELIS